MEEPPAAPAAPADPDIVNTSEEILQTQKKGTVHIEALLPCSSQLSSVPYVKLNKFTGTFTI